MIDPLAIGLGTAPLASSEDGPLWWGPQAHDERIATIVASIEGGASFIDTAPFYGWGLAEELVGEALGVVADRPPILSKCGTVRRPDGSAAADASPAAIRADVERGLERLGVDSIDVVQIHDPDPTTPIESSWECLMTLAAEGLIGGAGLSNHPPELMERASAVGPVAVVQHQHSLLQPAPPAVTDWCAASDVPFLGWAPLASGFLVDGFDLEALAEGDLRRNLPWARDGRDATVRVRAELAVLAERHACSMVDVAIAWAAAPPARGAIVGARTPAEASVFGRVLLDLTDDERQALAAAADG